jgi:hypothetical protein
MGRSKLSGRLRANKTKKFTISRQNGKTLLRSLAQIPLHPPVDSLHLLEKKRDGRKLFRLTQKKESVKQNRSLTVSRVFPVGVESGGRARSPSTSQDD